MKKFLAMSHHAAKRVTIWFSYLSIGLSLTGLMMIAQGSLNMDLEFSDTQPINPYFAVLMFGLIVTVLFYVLIFSIFVAVSVPVLIFRSLTKKNKIVRDTSL